MDTKWSEYQKYHPLISIIMTAYKRGHLIGDTLNSIFIQNTKDVEVLVIEDGYDVATKICCYSHESIGNPIRYWSRSKRPDLLFANPAPLINFGIKQARGEILIIQNAECIHVSNNVIFHLAAPHTTHDNLAVFAATLRLGEEVAPTNLTSPYFFCGSIRKEWMMKLRGVDEDYTGWGSDDCDLAIRMAAVGIEFEFRPDIVVHHQYHKPSNQAGRESNRKIFDDRSVGLRSGAISPVANQGREWGVIG